MERISQQAKSATVYLSLYYLICVAIVSLVVINELNGRDIDIFPNTREFRIWRRQILDDLDDSESFSSKIVVVADHALDVFKNHLTEMLILLVTVSFLPIQGSFKCQIIARLFQHFTRPYSGILMSIAPSWVVDAFEGVSSVMQSFEEEDVPPLELDPAFALLTQTHDVYIDGVKHVAEGSGANENDSTNKVSSNSNISSSPRGETTSVTPPRARSSSQAAVDCDQVVFDPVFGVISRELRDRWRRQERDARVLLESNAARRRHTLMPPVRYSNINLSKDSQEETESELESTSVSDGGSDANANPQQMNNIKSRRK